MSTDAQELTDDEWLAANAPRIVQPAAQPGATAVALALQVGQVFTVTRSVHPSTGRSATFGAPEPDGLLVAVRRMGRAARPDRAASARVMCGGDRGIDGYAYEAKAPGTVTVKASGNWRGATEDEVTYTVTITA